MLFVALGLCALAHAAYGQGSGCPEQHGVQTYPHPEACDHYYLCVNGTLSLEQCGNGLLYDGKGAVHEHCNYHWAVDCGHRKADLVPVSSDGCEFQFGIYPASSSCSTNYVKCAHGVPHLEPCDVGLAYDERIHGCNWPDQLLEKCNPEGVIGFKCPTEVDPHSTQAKFWPYPRFPVPGAPDRLITCVDGHPRINTCGDGKLFDESSLTCLDDEELHESKYNNLQ